MVRDSQRSDIAGRISSSVEGVIKEFGVHPVNLTPGVVWDGCVYGFSGYAKANRELLHRVSNTMAVELRPAFFTAIDIQNQVRLEPYLKIKTTMRCPYLRFFGPDRSTLDPRARIIYTMMETSKIHHEMMTLVNQNFDELWVPTKWNLSTFRASGLRIPGKVMPLGVNSVIYQPNKRDAALPRCTLISTSRRGLEGMPEGFLVLTIGVPSHRKGFDVLANAFEKAFARNRNAHLIVATTHATSNVPELESLSDYKSHIWTLTGAADEIGLSRIYNAVSCYASASRGEGWNLPAVEAAACGIPVILSDSSTHSEISGDNAWIFRNEGMERLTGIEKISPWYKGMYFTKMGNKSITHLAELLRAVRDGGNKVDLMAKKFREKVLTEWSWDRTADMISRRLMELQP